jgi:pilus assembly protein CpaB
METTRRRGILFLVIASVLALLAGVVVVSYLNDIERQAGETVEVVVAKKAIPARTLITADLLELRPISKKMLRQSYVLNPQDILRDTVALVDLQPGDILQRSFLDRNAGLKPGMRAVSIGVNRVSGVGGTIRAGNRVDVIVSFKEGGLAEANQKTSVLFQDVEVLGVSMLNPKTTQTSSLVTTSTEGQAAAEEIPPARFSATGDLLNEATVTLALPLEDALKLVWMENFGEEIRLVIRRLDEKEIPPAAPISISSFR